MKRILLLVTAAITILLVVALTGCGNDAGADEEAPEFVFVPDFTSLFSIAGDLPNIDNIILTESALYFTSTSDIDSNSLLRTTRIFKVDLDKSDYANLTGFTVLQNYISAPLPSGAEGGGAYISAMKIDADGYIWVAESSVFVTFDFPPGFDINDAEEGEIWTHHIPLESSYMIRKLDGTGTELLSVDIKTLVSSTQFWAGLNAFHIDDEENIIIGSGQSVFVLDTGGNRLFDLSTDGFVRDNSFVRLSDGRVALLSWNSRLLALTLQVIDTQNKAWGETIDLPADTLWVSQGNDEFLVVFSDGSNLLAIDRESNEITHILNWVASGVEPVGLDNILFLPDDRILFTSTTLEHDGTGSPSRHTELVVFNRTPHDEAGEKTVITLVSQAPHTINAAVVEFNRTNPLYRIELVNIGMNLDTLTEDIDKLALDMITGGGPDIIHTAYFPYNTWASRGFFADLYELIDADPMLDRSDIVESVLRSFEINGKLYQISPDFSIMTLIGHPDTTGGGGWSIDEFRAVLDANPQATMPLGEQYGGIPFLYSIVLSDITRFVDRESGNVYFDSSYFVDLLEFAYTLEVIISTNREDFHGTVFTPQPFATISSGEQIVEQITFNRFWWYSVFQDLFGGDFVFKGFPVDTGSGNSLSTYSAMAITAASENQQGAWEFLRMLMSEGWQSRQLRNDNFNIPTNRTVFDQSLADATEDMRNPLIGWNDLSTAIRPLTQEHVDKIRVFVDSASGVSEFTDPLMDIIRESAEDYFRGLITAQDAARIIQNRALTYVSEQG